QVPNNITIINGKMTKNIKILGIDVKFIKMKKDLFFGLISKKTKNKIKYSYSDSAKTDLDFFYLRRHDRIDNKTRRAKEYIKKYPTWLQKSI
ncbi:MAG: hypothetical protein Q8L34_05390, partial [Candidatus Woesearchaeota archaeon]|nr:hypothetical protein [Candidatus Woesearchaeota archaeon]